MISLPGHIEIGPAVSYLGPAVVAGDDDETGCFRVTFQHPENETGTITLRARMAIPSLRGLTSGDTVLVAGGSDAGLYIIGVLDSRTAGRPETDRLALSCGVRAEVSGTPDGQILRISDSRGGLMFEYDAATGKSRVNAPSGDLEFSADKGSIAFTSSKGICMTSAGAEGEGCSSIVVDAGAIGMMSDSLGMESKKGVFSIEETRFTGEKLAGTVGTAHLVMNRIESAAGTVVQKVKNIYQTVEELAQVHAGRMRTMVGATWHMKTKRMFLKAEDDVKIKGDKIYLG